MPVIPGLDDLAAIRFDETWQRARGLRFDEACCLLEGFYEVGKHHPALQPEMALLKALAAVHHKLCNNVVTERLEKL